MAEQLNFSISGEFLTDLARSWYFDEGKDYSKSEELLMNCMVTEEDSDELIQYKKQVALDIIEGRKMFVGINNLTLIDDVRGVPIRLVQLEELTRKLNLVQKENEELTATVASQQEVIRVTKEVSDGYKDTLDKINAKMKTFTYMNSPVYRLRVHFSRSNMLDPLTKSTDIIRGMKVTEEMTQEIVDLCKQANIYPVNRRHGFWEWMSFYDRDTDELMSSEDLIERGFAIRKEESEEKLSETQEDEENVDIREPEYGWLSPSGEFKESPWGTHEGSAQEIVEKNGWNKEFRSWDVRDKDNPRLARDFLVQVKGYVLIDNPIPLVGRPKATYESRLTKKQKDFLYGYFIDAGDDMMANYIMKDEV